MNIFISYRHTDQIVALQIAENLRQQVNGYIFFDERSIDQVNFERSILLHMRQSDVVLVIVTEHTFALERIAKNDDWVRRELGEALQLNKQVIPVCIYPSTLPGYPLPFDIAAITHMHSITLYPGNRIFDASMQNLIDFVHRIAGTQGESMLQKTREALLQRDYISAQRELDKIHEQLAIYAEPQYVARGAFYQALILLNKNRPCVQTLPLIRAVWRMLCKFPDSERGSGEFPQTVRYCLDTQGRRLYVFSNPAASNIGISFHAKPLQTRLFTSRPARL